MRQIGDIQAGKTSARSRRGLWLNLCFLLGVFVVFAPFAQAQETDFEGKKRNQRGIRTKSLVVFPALFVESKYDSNLFRNAEEEGEVSAIYLQARPGLTLINRARKNVALKFGFIGDVRHYFSDAASVKAQGQLGGTAELVADFFPKSKFKLGVFDHLKRALESPNLSTPQSLDMLRNEAGIRLTFRPGGTKERRPLSFTVGYLNRIVLYDDFERGETFAHAVFMNAVWLVYPKTALVLDASMESTSFLNEDPYQTNVDSTPIRGMFGVDGLITRRIALVAKAGWGQSGHASGDSFAGVIADARFIYSPNPGMRFMLSYKKDFSISYVGNYYSYHQAGMDVSAQLGQSIRCTVGGSYIMAAFGLYAPQGTTLIYPDPYRNDNVINGHIRLSFDLIRAFGISLGYGIDRVDSDYEARDSSNNILDRGSYMRHTIFGSLDFRY